MPRHAYRFDEAAKSALRNHVAIVVNRLSHARYRQEPNYTAALVGALDGFEYAGTNSSIQITGTVVDDRGRNAAERWAGADFAITAEITNGQLTVRKAILLQAKRGLIADLSDAGRDNLNGQIVKMRSLTRSPKVIEYPTDDDHAMPTVISGNRLRQGQPYRRTRLDDYFVGRVLTTFDGDTRPSFVAGVQHSGLTTLHFLAISKVGQR